MWCADNAVFVCRGERAAWGWGRGLRRRPLACRPCPPAACSMHVLLLLMLLCCCAVVLTPFWGLGQGCWLAGEEGKQPAGRPPPHLWRWEEVLEHVGGAQAQLGAQVLQDEVGVGLADGAHLHGKGCNESSSTVTVCQYDTCDNVEAAGLADGAHLGAGKRMARMSHQVISHIYSPVDDTHGTLEASLMMVPTARDAYES